MKMFIFDDVKEVLEEVEGGVWFDFVAAEKADEAKAVIELGKEYLCGIGLYEPKVEDIESSDFVGKDFPLVVYSEDKEVIEHVKAFASVVAKDEYLEACKKVALGGGL